MEDQRLFAELVEAVGERGEPSGRPLASQIDSTPTIADAIEGYQILSELHRGGQGVVYNAIQSATKRPVALKVLLDGPFASLQQQLRFEREIDLVASLKHPNVVTLYDSGSCQGRQFYAMELVNGQTLDRFVAGIRSMAAEPNRSSARRRAVRQVLQLFEKICRAVGYAHTRGVMHRDLKPSNILIDENGEPHVLDFGLAKLSSDSSDRGARPTLQGEFLGTLAYASPEQTEGDPRLIDVRTDVYSLGVILYEMLTSEYPYVVEGTISHVLENIRCTPAVRPSRIRPGIDDDIDTITLKAMAKEQDRRYGSAEQLARDVRLYLADEPIDAKRDSAWYVFRKTLHRYHAAVATVAAFFVVIAAALVLSLAALRQAKHDRQQAETDREKAVEAGQAAQSAKKEADAQRDEAQFQAYAANISAASLALKIIDVADARLRLQRAPVEKRNWEWFHFQGRLDSSLLTLTGNREYVEDLKLFPDRPWVMAVGWDNTVRIWHVNTGEPIAKLELPAHAVSMDINRDGDLIAVGDSATTVRVWQVPSWERVFEFSGPAQRVADVEFVPDGSQLVASFWAVEDEADADNMLIFFDTESFNEVRRIPLDTPAQRMHFHPDGKMLASFNRLGTVFLDPSTGKQLRRLSHDIFLAFSADAERFATLAFGPVVNIYSFEADEPLVQCHGHTAEIVSAQFNRDGTRIVTAAHVTKPCACGTLTRVNNSRPIWVTSGP